ncbi:uncharacterized protein LOC125042091 [Penaeus chinensis]|uniref:uncharacterized protein LOC125042091 n=1 Tax=Penaeus chinensis TaxID=139456 RepID=UPI001FB5B09E|nr:uncharacterized protein LOC125042091 [Penaeus chinensis]
MWDEEPMPFLNPYRQVEGHDAFLSPQPPTSLKHRGFLQVPWLLGTNKEDGAFRVQGQVSWRRGEEKGRRPNPPIPKKHSRKPMDGGFKIFPGRTPHTVFSSKLDFIYKQEFSGDSASKVSTHMLMLWTNFVKGSDPTPKLKGWPEDVSPWGAWWEPFVKGYLYYLRIDPEMDSQDVPLKEENMAFWDSLPLFENRDQNVIRDEL